MSAGASLALGVDPGTPVLPWPVSSRLGASPETPGVGATGSVVLWSPGRGAVISGLVAGSPGGLAGAWAGAGNAPNIRAVAAAISMVRMAGLLVRFLLGSTRRRGQCCEGSPD